MKRKIEVTEARRTTTVRFWDGGEPPARPCAACGGDPQLYRLEEAARRTGISTREICRAVDGGSVHFVELAGDLLWVCVFSLIEFHRSGHRPLSE